MQSVVFDPVMPVWLVAALAAAALAVLGVGFWRGLSGWWLRGLAALVLLLALLNPLLREEDRSPVANVALVVIDESSSNGIGARREMQLQAAKALDAELERISAGTALEVRRRMVADRGEEGTRLVSALAELAAEVPADRIAAAILVTDGQVHDAEALAEFSAPVHVLLTGSAADFDRTVTVETAPAFAIVGETVELKLRVEDLGAGVAQPGSMVPILITLDANEPNRFEVPLGTPVTLPVTLQRGGANVLQISTPEVEGELTPRNNTAIVSINGVRDRLRVLLVSGEPYPGERTWRNLLKSDSAVDLVHFTILRPPNKQDFVPVFELSLIAFPTQELFMEKVDEFDLIIFDRYRRRGILPDRYFENIGRYVRDGGALLIATGEDFAGAESLYRTPLRDVLPVVPTARLIEEPFLPTVSGIGERHPVTAGLEAHAPVIAGDNADGPGWGRWLRQIEVETVSGQTVMTGEDELPLLVLDRAGEGRIAVLASDHAWLWSRGFEGGGPQLELLRRLAHWMMQEPELEEEVLTGTGESGTVSLQRRTLADDVPPVRATGPDGEVTEVELRETAPGLWQGSLEAGGDGLWKFENGDKTAVAVVGPAAPKEYVNPVSTGAVLKPLADATRGTVLRLEDGIPELRYVRGGRVAAGRGWIGLVDRQAYQLRDIRQIPLAPGWLLLLLSAGLVVAAWRLEGR